MPKARNTRPQKPRPDFPLFPHATGRWAKKVRGRLVYFGKVSTDPKGQAALAKWLEQRDDLLAGRTPRPKTGAVTVADLCNQFLTSKQDRLTAGELCQQTFADYHSTCARLVAAFGRTRAIDDLVADDFRRLRAQLAKHWGPVRLATEIQRLRGVFKYGYEAGLLDKPVRFGPDFHKPSAKVLRLERAKRGLRMYEREELLALLAAAGSNLKAMLLLGINGGLGNSDVARLTFKALNLDGLWLTYPRPKTGIERRIPLWPETVEAVKAAIAQRPEPKDAADKQLIFIGPSRKGYGGGAGWMDGVFGQIFESTAVRRRGFYALRHTFQTIAEGVRDLAAVQSIMGHAASGNDMSAVYRERVDDARLVAVTEHVRKWLFGDTKQE